MRWFFSTCIGSVWLLLPLMAQHIDSSFEESLKLRRIAEYWKEKDYSTAKIQIREFLHKNPKSAFVDPLYAMLGDLYFQEKNFKEANESYEKIVGKEFRQKCLFHRLHCLYEIGKYDDFLLLYDLFLKDPRAKSDELNTIRFELAEIYFHKGNAPENAKKKKEFYKAAQAEYQQLMQTPFSEMTLLPQAQIYAFFEEYLKAASLYLLLAHQHTDKKEDYLFQAACLQLHKDKKSAIETFAAIVELNGKYASKAAFNQLSLLYQEKRYRDFILAQDKALKHVSQDKLPLLYYYLGKSFLHTGDFQRAIDPFIQSLSATTLDRTQEKSALLSLIACAKETHDFPLFEKTLAHLKAAFPNEEETAQVLLMHAQMCRDKKEWSKARLDLKELLDFSPHCIQREALYYDHALLLVQEGKWQEAGNAFEEFFQNFPQSANRVNALRHALNCRLEDLKHSSKETQRIKKEQLLFTLNQVSQEKKGFTSAEMQKIRYLQGKTYFELVQYEEAIAILSDYTRDFPKDPTCVDVYLLLAYAYQHDSRDEIHFAINAEKALALNPHLSGAIDLHLTLYNTYLSLAKKVLPDEKADMMAKAADHLFLALSKPISQENQRWLANYYFQHYQKHGDENSLKRAAAVLEHMLGSPSTPTLSLETEGEVIQLADMYAKMKRWAERAKLLETLFKEYQVHPDIPWKYQRLLQFELGKTYLHLDEKEKALYTFETLISSSSHVSSYFAMAAQLEKAKLKYAMLKKEERHENSQAILAICDLLKEIQIKRKLHSEPLHLEAALYYVDIKSDLVPTGQKNERKRFLLQQVKESFTEKNDPLVKQYLAAAPQFPDKERLYHHYLAFIDAELLHIEAEENHSSILNKACKDQLDSLLKEVSDETLRERILKVDLYKNQSL